MPANDLDGSRHPPRSKEHTELISAEFKLGQLWDEYGLVEDVVVSSHSICATQYLLFLHVIDFCIFLAIYK